MEVFDFMIENYIWFIIGGIVILMVLIGYFAEKTQFGKKPTEKKQKLEEKKTVQADATDHSEIQEEFDETDSVEESVNQDTASESEKMIETSSEDVVEETEEPMEDLDAIEIREPEIKEEKSATEELLNEVEESEVPEDLYAGLDGTPNAYKPEEEPTPAEDFDLDLPNIDALKDDMDSSLAEDDIWRF